MKKFVSLLLTAALLLGAVSGVFAEGVKYTTETTKDGWIKVVNEGGATLGYMPGSGVTLIEDDGFAFKDMNRNGKLDVYEDWRLDDKARAEDLVAQLSVDNVLALMMHPSITSINETFDDGGIQGATVNDSEDVTLKQLVDMGVRSSLTRGESYPAATEAKFSNNIQAQAEGLDFAIPFNFSSDPRIATRLAIHNLSMSNIFDMDKIREYGHKLAISFRSCGITTYLGPQIDLATEPRWQMTGAISEDPQLAIDMTNALISGLQSTLDADGNDLGWGSESVNAMMKHWVGNSAGEGGREGHGAAGKYHVFPGDQFDTATAPFIDGGLNLDSLTGQAASVMTTYTVAYSEDEEYGELVGSGFSKFKIDLLRSYGFEGIVCTDFGVFNDGGNGYGVEDLTEAERVVKGIEAGVDQLGGYGNFDKVKEAYGILCEKMGAEAAEARIRESAYRSMLAMFHIDMFENPYLIASEATRIFNDKETKAFMEDLTQSSVVMLKNNDNLIHQAAEGERKKVYVPMTYGNPGGFAMLIGAGSTLLNHASLSSLDKYFDVVTDTLGEPTGPVDFMTQQASYGPNDVIRASAEEIADCDFVLVIVDGPLHTSGYETNPVDGTVTYKPIALQYGTYTARGASVRDESIAGDLKEVELVNPYGTYMGTEKENRSYYGQSSTVSNTEELDTILYGASLGKPVVVCINAQNPMIFSEFEDKVDAILFDYECDFMVAQYDMFLPIVAGLYEPQGLLGMQMPANMETVEEQYEDVPRDMECYVDSNGNAYDFTFGLNWSGVINDERVAKYNVEPKVGVTTEKIA